jgi:hypothetical protein
LVNFLFERFRPCIPSGSRGLFLIAALLCCVARPAQAQLIAGFGANAGYSHAPTDAGMQIEAFYDVPIGLLYFSPGVKVMFSDNSMFSVDTRIRFPLFGSNLHLGFGGNVMIWEDRASIGVPIEFTYPVPLAPRLQLNTGVAVTPHFFLGKEKDGVMYSAFIGIRSPVL